MKLDLLGILWSWCGGQNPFACFFSVGGGSKSSSKSGTRYNTDFLKSFYTDFPAPYYTNEGEGVTVEDVAAAPTTGKTKKGQPIPNYPRQQFTLGLPQWQGLENLPQYTALNEQYYPTSTQLNEYPTFTPLAEQYYPQFTGLEDMDFNKLQESLYARQKQALEPDFTTGRARTREELSQSGLLNSPVAYASGGALDTLEKNYYDQLQKAASEAAYQTVGLKQSELQRQLTAGERAAALRQSELARRQTAAENLAQLKEQEYARRFGEQEATAKLRQSELARQFESGMALTNVQREELARKLGFSMDIIKLIETIMQQRAQVALESGRYGTQSSSTSPSFGLSGTGLAGAGGFIKGLMG